MSLYRKQNLAWILTAVLLISAITTVLSGCNNKTGNTGANLAEDKASNGKAVEIKIAAASDVQPAFEELGKILKAQTGIKSVFIFGSSGQLSQQMISGAKVDVLASADEAYVDKVIAAGIGLKETRQQYATGRLVIVSGSNREALSDISQLRYMKVNKIAIANPDHAPYGRAAREALTTAGIWMAVKPKLVFGENARQAFQYAETGNADIAFAPLSLVKAAEGVSHYVVPANMHEPINQTLVVTKSGNKQAALKFIELLTSKTGIETLSKYGFERNLDIEKGK